MKNTVVNLQFDIQIIHNDDVVLTKEDIAIFIDTQLQGVDGWEGLITADNIVSTETFDVEVEET
jgi:hypothetical protein